MARTGTPRLPADPLFPLRMASKEAAASGDAAYQRGVPRGARKPADPNFPKRLATKEAIANATEIGSENPPDDSGPDAEGGAQTLAGADTEIGLSPDPPPVAESDPEVDTYVCGRCRSSIEHGQESCKICNARMNW